MRNRHIRATAEGIFNPFDKSKPAEILVGQTKMHQAFKDSSTFFSAWNVYASIRSTYQPERAPGLFLFAERIYFLIQLNYTWHSILNYILTFFRDFQNSDPEKWNVLDGVLVAHQFSVSQQKQTPANNKAGGGTGKPNKSTSTSRVPISEQTCNNWNNEKLTAPPLAIRSTVVPSIDNSIFSRMQMQTNSRTTYSSLHAGFISQIISNQKKTSCKHCISLMISRRHLAVRYLQLRFTCVLNFL